MLLLILKILGTPLAIGCASLAARRWGAHAGGLIVALPLTSGPVLLVVAVQWGPELAADTAHAALAGCVSIAACAVGYGNAHVRGWRAASIAALAAWLAGAVIATAATALSIAGTLAVVLAAATGALALAREPRSESPPVEEGWTQIALRMATATLIVVCVSELTPFVGPVLAGLLAMVPIASMVLAVFAERAGDRPAALAFWRGGLWGVYGTAAFIATLGLTLVPFGIIGGYLAATASFIIVQTCVLRVGPAVQSVRAGSARAAKRP